MLFRSPLVRHTEPTSRMLDVPLARMAFEAQSIEEAYRVCKLLVASGMMPKHIRTPEAMFAILATGRELGLPMMQATRSLHYLDGKPTLSADLIVALVKRHPECEYFRVVSASNEAVTMETKRRGEPEPVRITWTIDDAQRAGVLGKENWKKYPRAMLRARVSTELARAVFPDAALGLYDPDELSREPPVLPEPVVIPDPAVVEAASFHEDVDARAELAQSFAERIEAASSLRELLDLRQEVKKADLPDLLRAALAEAWTAKKKQLESNVTR